MKIVVVPVTPFMQNCTVLVCEATAAAAAVDPGGDLGAVKQAIVQAGGHLEKVLLTHGHIDHAGGAGALAREFGVPVEGPQREDAFWLDALEEQGRMFGLQDAGAVVPDRWLEQGDRVQFGRIELEVYHCPGHTPGHVVFFHRDSRVAFVGDVLFRGSIGRTDFPRGDHATLIASIRERLWPLGEDVRFVPGHGPMSTFGEERRSNPFVADGA
ncbi:MAG: MBL fold metallo-hydrolase [Gammaproteobacteria bacterium]|nr:MBL fold metallo-hydrolase [Gammaproteobacteria bacterium]